MIIKTDKEEFASFLSDAANFKGDAEAVYFPENEEELKSILKECALKGIKTTIAGNGTGVTGARVPQGGVVISTSKLNRILEINKENKFALVEGGVLLKDFQDAVEAAGLFYPPDPTERNCFVGATIATNASGARTFKYGPTRNYVMGLRVILAGGDALELERGEVLADGYKLELTADSGRKIKINVPRYEMPPTKNTAGYYSKENIDAVDLFIGSEGTLGVIYSAKLRLLKLPAEILSCVQFFNEEDDALSFIEEARLLSYQIAGGNENSLIDARGLEFFDSNSLRFMESTYNNIPKAAKGAVWFEQEYSPENEKIILDKWSALIAKHRGNIENAWIAFNKADYEKFKDFRHSISWQVNEYCTRNGVMKVGTDTAVPHEMFREFYRFCVKLVTEANMNYVAYGHAGNSHIHLNMLPANHESYTKARELYGIICRKAVELGGTVSAEHGIGKLKKGYLLDMYGEENIRQMAKLKYSLDPGGILGPGNIFDEKYINELRKPL